MEYKFRGLGLYSKKWVYGNLIHMDDADENYRDVIIPIEDNCTYVDSDDGYAAEDWHKVDSKTVGICTGVKDINKKESYLGDILKPTSYSEFAEIEKLSFGIVKKEEENNNLYVEWNFKDYDLEEKPYWKTVKIGLSYIKDFEIVGSIYTNPDMIKKEG